MEVSLLYSNFEPGSRTSVCRSRQSYGRPFLVWSHSSVARFEKHRSLDSGKLPSLQPDPQPSDRAPPRNGNVRPQAKISLRRSLARR